MSAKLQVHLTPSVPIPTLARVHYHRDYDGLVAAAMLGACCAHPLVSVPQDYGANASWAQGPLGDHAAVVDFLYHPEAVLWVDHHDTAFASAQLRPEHQGSAFHVLDPAAASCPEVIVRQAWFAPRRMRRLLPEYVRWSRVIDGASYTGPAQANDLDEPHVMLAMVIAACPTEQTLTELIEAVQRHDAREVLANEHVAPVVTELRAMDRALRGALALQVRVHDRVAMLDQSDWSLPYRRYLAFEVHPSVNYAVGIYRSAHGYIVSVGENPWNRTRATHLGRLCEPWGGGGRAATAGVPAPNLGRAREIAAHLVDALRDTQQVAAAR